MNHTLTISVLFIALVFDVCITVKNEPATEPSPFENAKLMCQSLESLNINNFMKQITGSFQYTCARLKSAAETEYRTLFNVVLTMAGQKVSFASKEEGCNLCVKTDRTVFLMEFKVNSRSAQALADTEKYREALSENEDGDKSDREKDVLCLGINYRFAGPTENSTSSQLLCDWRANLYFPNGTVRKEYVPHRITLTCVDS